MNIHNVLSDWQKIAEKLFPDANAKGSLEHAMQEVDEIINEPNRPAKIVEYADVFMCLVTAMNQDGISIDEVSEAIVRKGNINLLRKWVKVIGIHGIYYKHIK